MEIGELLSIERIALKQNYNSKEEVYNALINMHAEKGFVKDKEVFKKAIWAREDEVSTAIENGVVIPHAKTSTVSRASLAVVTLEKAIDCDSFDKKESDLFIMIAVPEEAANEHLKILQKLMGMLIHEDFLIELKACESPVEFINLINNYNKLGETKSKMKKIMAVTACPTGIAHTYMAKEALEIAGKKLGYEVIVEANGSSGVENRLKQKDIDESIGVIIAADKNVEMDRFNGKKVIITGVTEGIKDSEKLVKKIADGDAKIYSAKNTVNNNGNDEDAKASVGKTIYKHLMSGVSYMLPFVVGGGILIALAFLFDDYTINPSNFGSNLFFARVLKTIGGIGFGFMLPVLAGYIAYSIADRPGLAVGFVGGSLAAAGTSFSSLAGTSSAVSSGFLGALLAGFVGGYAVVGLRKLTAKMPKSMDGIKPMLIYPLCGMFVIGIVMLLINPAMSSINTGVTNWLNGMGGTSKVLLGIILGAMMCVDMGGPINKAAYVFGTASLASGNYDVMAAVMVGGMVPPLVIALSTTFAKKKWSEKDRQAGYVNYIMGLCFISEGAIPYAAKDPLRVIPACMIGGGLAGALSMAFGCTLMAPHGGIFVFPTIGNVGGYSIALLAGAAVGALILTILKKNYVAE